MSLTPGTKLAHYEILEPIGKGGMGEVYRAKDGKLERDVAIKVLPDEFAENEERLARFKREAKVLAALNHPNIASIYGLEQSDSTHYLVLELVPGETLAERIARGPIPLEEALDIASQMAEALEEAHEQSIVHRDLKPANVKQTEDDKIKVLDFGLAKVFQEETEADSSMSPTLTRDATRVGVILGTAAYMSPEQAKGKPVDKRTDIWAFGCVLYEVLTGKKAFGGETVSETIAEVIRGEPDWEALPAWTPRCIRRLLERCLRKDAKARLRDIGEARIVIGESSDGSGEVATMARPRPFLAGALMLMVAAGGFLLRASLDEPSSAPPVMRFGVSLGVSQRLEENQDVLMAMSPTGRHLAYIARSAGQRLIHVRALDEMEARSLEGTEAARDLFFSPDGRWIGFVSGGQLKKISVDGGTPIELAASAASRGGTWGSDGFVYFAPSYSSAIVRVPDTGGDLEPVTVLEVDEGERSHRWPHILPEANALVLTVDIGDNPSDYDDARIDVVSLATRERRRLIEHSSMARYVTPGLLVFSRGSSLFAAAFDSRRLELSGGSVSVLDGVGRSQESGAAYFDVSNNGTLAYVPSASLGTESMLSWVARDGATEVIPAPPRDYGHVRLSPEGGRIAVTIDEQAWVYDLERKTLTRFSVGAGVLSPIWTPDGSRLTYMFTQQPGMVFLEATGRDA